MNFKITLHDPDGRIVTKKPIIHSTDSTKFFEFGFSHSENQVFEIEIDDETSDEEALHYSLRVGERLRETVDERGNNYPTFEELVKHFVSSNYCATRLTVTRSYLLVDLNENALTPEILEDIQHACLGRDYLIGFDVNNKIRLQISI